MGGSPGDVSENPETQERRKKGWRVSCDVDEVTEKLQNELCSFSNLSVALPTSQLILRPFRCFTYVKAHSPALLSLLLRLRIFTYVTWRAAHETSSCVSEVLALAVEALVPLRQKAVNGCLVKSQGCVVNHFCMYCLTLSSEVNRLHLRAFLGD